jgi:hypothetical protein
MASNQPICVIAALQIIKSVIARETIAACMDASTSFP